MYWNLAEKYVLLLNGILAIYLHGRESQPQYIVPGHLRSRILEELHDCAWGAHLRGTRTFEKITKRFYWEGLRQHVINWISSCQGWATRKLPTNPITMGMQLQVGTSPWQVVVIDRLGPLSTYVLRKSVDHVCDGPVHQMSRVCCIEEFYSKTSGSCISEGCHLSTWSPSSCKVGPRESVHLRIVCRSVETAGNEEATLLCLQGPITGIGGEMESNSDSYAEAVCQL